MTKIYKIHPAIGIARVGTSTEGFFLESDTLTGTPFELDNTGEKPFKGYKDTHYQIRKQGVRFRVFEYDRDAATGTDKLIGEVNTTAEITWTIALGNGKAAGYAMGVGTGLQGERVIAPNFNNNRNPGVTDRASLFPHALASTSGKNQVFKELAGQIMGKTITLGAAATDFNGSLIVTGGSGEAASWHAIPDELGDFLNNDGWYDTTADGSIDAVIKLADGTTAQAEGAWVIIGPPDFAPGILPIVSLWDLMTDALVRVGKLKKDTTVSYEKHIKPVLEKAAAYRWIHSSSLWSKLLKVMAENDLSDKSDAMKPTRDRVSKAIQTSNPLTDFRLTPTQAAYFKQWVEGDFEPSVPAADKENTQAYLLDQAALTRAIGSGLFPGIEMGFMATNGELFSEPFRFTRQAFHDMNGAAIQLEPGKVIQRMACPWQADFMECAGNWWPAQRPDLTHYKEDGSAQDILWTRGLVVGGEEAVQSHLNMVSHFSELGVVEEVTVNGKQLFIEKGRNPALQE